jgi:KDO2-lipid IV(A) lauroyltransferase
MPLESVPARAPAGELSMLGLKDKLTGAGYGLGWSVVCRLPQSWARRGFRSAADIAWRRRGLRVKVLEGNLRRVIGGNPPDEQLRALSRETMRSYARYWLEVFRLPVTPAERLAGGMHDSGHLQTALGHVAAGRGVVFALPHMGNYDQAAAWMIASGAGSPHHRCGAAETRVALPEVRRVPRGTRLGGRAGHRRTK